MVLGFGVLGLFFWGFGSGSRGLAVRVLGFRLCNP